MSRWEFHALKPGTRAPPCLVPVQQATSDSMFRVSTLKDWSTSRCVPSSAALPGLRSVAEWQFRLAADSRLNASEFAADDGRAAYDASVRLWRRFRMSSSSSNRISSSSIRQMFAGSSRRLAGRMSARALRSSVIRVFRCSRSPRGVSLVSCQTRSTVLDNGHTLNLLVRVGMRCSTSHTRRRLQE